MVPAAEGLSRWRDRLRETVKIGSGGNPVRAEGLGKVEGMLRLLQFSCEQAGMTGIRIV